MSLSVRLKDSLSFVIYGDEEYGRWVQLDEEEGEYFSFYLSSLTKLFSVEATYSDGEKEEMYPLKAKWEFVTPEESWSSGGENKVRVTLEEGSCEVSVPVLSPREYIASCPVLETDKALEIVYRRDRLFSGACLFVPEKDGYYSFISTHAGEEDPEVTLRDMESFRELGRNDDSPAGGYDFLLKVWLHAGRTYIVDAKDHSGEISSFTVLAYKTEVSVISMTATLKDPKAVLVYGDSSQGAWASLSGMEGEWTEETGDYFAFTDEAVKSLFDITVTYEEGDTKTIDPWKVYAKYETPMEDWILGNEYDITLYHEEGSVRVTVPVISLKESRGEERGPIIAAGENPGRPRAKNTKGGVRIQWNPVKGVRKYEVYRKIVGSPERATKLGSTAYTSFLDDEAEEYRQVKYYVRSVPYVIKGIQYQALGKSKSRLFVPMDKPYALKAKVRGAKVTLTWNQKEEVTGYEVRYAPFVPTKGGTVISAQSGVGLTLEPATWNFTYRSYVEVKGKKIYSPWAKRTTVIVGE